ncbi:tripartite tricarboxylate transporter TctB family protein [Candidatus Poribacteria bacterium]
MENIESQDSDISEGTSIDEDTRRMRDKDVLFSILLMLGSCALIIYSLVISLEAMKTVHAEFYTAPGFSTLAVSAGLLLLGIRLLVIALRQHGDLRWLAPGRVIEYFRLKSFRQTAAVLFCLYLYMCLFWGKISWFDIHVPFWLTTFVFLSSMMLIFRATKIYRILIISGLISVLTVLVFKSLVGVPLP